MGEAKRRRALYSELTKFTAGELHSMGAMCAWDGCDTTYENDEGQNNQPPHGWRIIYTMQRYSGTKLPNGEPVLRIFSGDAGLERDCVLCPQHAKALEQQLKRLGTELLAPAQGTA